ncbi:MAG: hypothetical protein IEMM0006_1599 [bacterium]|nr:MAG: hypothetical protein IEMM0006_1599 [bacterium]
MESGKNIKPTSVFIFGLPRSGTTLLQRILMANPEIASASEPWILLPFLYARKQTGILAEYSHNVAYLAINDFINNLPNKEVDYYKELEGFVSSLYAKYCINNEKYFLDKTPPYLYIIPEIIKTFPNAKFIFLFRNPVQILSSVMNTWGNGGFDTLYRWIDNLFSGPKLLAEGFLMSSGKSIGIRYEDLIREPDKTVKKLCDYLQLKFNKSMLSDFNNQELKGFVDPTGIKNYNKIDNSPLDKWKKTFNSRCRKRFVINYIYSIDEATLRTLGYNKKELKKELLDIKAKRFCAIKDIVSLIKVKLILRFKLNIFFSKKYSEWAKGKYLS